MKNAVGINKILLADERCFCPTSKPFWKFPEDIKAMGVKTLSQTKNASSV